MKVQFTLLTTNLFSHKRSFVSSDPAEKKSDHPSSLFSHWIQFVEAHDLFFQWLTSSLSILWVFFSLIRLLSISLFSLYCRCRRLLGSFDSPILKFHRTMYCVDSMNEYIGKRAISSVCAYEKEFQTLSLSSEGERERKRRMDGGRGEREKRERNLSSLSLSISLTRSNECTNIPLRTLHMRYILWFSDRN